VRLTNLLNLPAPLVAAVSHDDYSRGESDISITQLLDPPRKVALQAAHDRTLTEDVADRIWALLGQSIHAILERADHKGIKEHRLYADIGGWHVSGQFDRLVGLYDEHGGRWVLQDYKLCSTWEVIGGLKPEKTAQLNCYAYLASVNGYAVNGLEIVTILRDWSKMKAKRERDYPQQQVRVIPVCLWPAEETAAYLRERVRLHHEAAVAPDHQLPLCTAEERWARPTVWAVMKQGRKSALKLCETPEMAADYLTQQAKPSLLSVIERPGESVRCRYYCAAASVCNQAQAGSAELS